MEWLLIELDPPSSKVHGHRSPIFFFKSEFISREHTTRHRRGRILLYGENQQKLVMGSMQSYGGVVMFWSRFSSYPSSHLACGLEQALVFSKNRSISWTRFELAKSWGSVRGWH